MARTLSGRLTGKAASTELREQREWITREIGKKKFEDHWANSMDLLRELDPNWSEFYDLCPQQTNVEMLPIIDEHIEILEDIQWLT